MSVATRYYPMDVSLMTFNSLDYSDIFTDCTLNIEVETETAKAARDIQNSDLGFEYAVQRGRGWTAKLGSVIQTDALADATPASRAFGFNLTLATLNGHEMNVLFKDLTLNITREFVESRAVMDALLGGNAGWRYPRIKGQRLSLDIDSVVEGDSSISEFEDLISSWQQESVPYAYVITAAGGFSATGHATLAGGDFSHTTDESSRRLRLMCHGKPTIPATTDVRHTTAQLMAQNPNTFPPTTSFVLHRPHQTSYSGLAWIEEASIKFPTGAVQTGMTLRGWGPLALN